MRILGSFLFLFALCLAGPLAISAQETEERVVDEVVAVVNESVITLSKVRRETKEIVEAGIQQGKTREDAQREVDEKRGELIANLIHEELLIQKAKELGFDNEIDANVNRRFLDIMKEYNLKTLDALYQEMEKTGVNPVEIRDIWKKQATRELVIQKEVQAKIYWQLSAKELKDYFDQHKDKFTRPETVTVSEIFLSFAGRDVNAVNEKAKQLVAQLRASGDFDKLAKENSDPGIVTQGGKAGKLRTAELSPLLISALKDVKVGSYTDPIAADQVGVVILRVDAREKATSESYFDENVVRMAIVTERAPTDTKAFLASLRTESYIKISDSYRPLVSPILFAEDRKEKTEANPSDKSEEKPAGKSEKKPANKSASKSSNKRTK
ncbi:MAG: peptidyl-prolyl cis-trans isomerase [Acidobacteriota bacterium]